MRQKHTANRHAEKQNPTQLNKINLIRQHKNLQNMPGTLCTRQKKHTLSTCNTSNVPWADSQAFWHLSCQTNSPHSVSFHFRFLILFQIMRQDNPGSQKPRLTYICLICNLSLHQLNMHMQICIFTILVQPEL